MTSIYIFTDVRPSDTVSHELVAEGQPIGDEVNITKQKQCKQTEVQFTLGENKGLKSSK